MLEGKDVLELVVFTCLNPSKKINLQKRKYERSILCHIQISFHCVAVIISNNIFYHYIDRQRSCILFVIKSIHKMNENTGNLGSVCCMKYKKTSILHEKRKGLVKNLRRLVVQKQRHPNHTVNNTTGC